MSSTKAINFIREHGIAPERVDILRCAREMCEDMERGLAGESSSMPMIPTYLVNDGNIPEGQTAIVVDAGGTNFRCAAVTFCANGCEVKDITRYPMPGIDRSVTWGEFISFVADSVMPLVKLSDRIGFCFSYSADITPEIDGKVNRIDKEVVITGCEGEYIGRSLNAELERRGVFGKKIFILNDTAAVLLGGAAKLDKSLYGGFIGQVSGTGTNTCCILPLNRITKLGRSEDTGIIVNLESGLYNGLPIGDFDVILDAGSNNPGEKSLEKLTAGVYLGEFCRIAVFAAEKEGLLGQKTCDAIRSFGSFDASKVDEWASGNGLAFCENAEDEEFIETLCHALFERSARCMCVNLLAILLLTGEGTEAEKPVCVCAEGSLVQKSRNYRPMLEAWLAENCAAIGRYAIVNVDYETTLPGSAAAAILN